MRTIIAATGSHFPERVINNSYFLDRTFLHPDGSPMAKPTAEIVAKLEEITGIKERRYVLEEEDSIPLMVKAAQATIEDWMQDSELIDGIIVAHNAGNMLPGVGAGFHTVPNTAAILKNRLKIRNYNCFAYDILFGCPGWVQGLIQAHQTIQMGDAKNILVVGLEVGSRLVDPYDLDSMILADGCGAAILSASHDTSGVRAYHTYSHAQEDLSCIYLDKSYNKDLAWQSFFKMNGRDVYRYATTWVPKVIYSTLQKANWSVSDVDMFLFHQANGKMLHAIANNIAKLSNVEDISFDGKIPSTIQFTGNTSVATIPVMLDMIRKQNLQGYNLKKGDKIIFASVGAGMHCNAMAYEV